MAPLPPRSGRWLWLFLFAVAMAQLEAAVVVYLRELFYPDGFRFPLVIIEGRTAAVEIGREAATLVMLVAVARVAFEHRWRRFAAFLFVFGAWDIFYYLWLKVMLDWPASLLTDDILFLIPLPWTGPVLSAASIAAIMVVSAGVIESLLRRGLVPDVPRWGWVVVVASALSLLVIFMLDAPAIVRGEMPPPFRWWAFVLALLPSVLVAARAAWRARPDSGRGEET